MASNVQSDSVTSKLTFHEKTGLDCVKTSNFAINKKISSVLNESEIFLLEGLS